MTPNYRLKLKEWSEITMLRTYIFHSTKHCQIVKCVALGNLRKMNQKILIVNGHQSCIAVCVCVCVCVCACVCACVSVRACMRACMHACVCACVRACVHVCVHVVSDLAIHTCMQYPTVHTVIWVLFRVENILYINIWYTFNFVQCLLYGQIFSVIFSVGKFRTSKFRTGGGV